MKKFLIVLLAVLSLISLSSCDDMKALMDLIPKFDGNLPNNISGQYAYFRTEEDKAAGIYTKLYSFSSKTGIFTAKDESAVRSGKYEVSYKTYAITECNGTIKLSFDDGSTESYDFYYYATAVDGPEYIRLSDGRTYYYWGN